MRAIGIAGALLVLCAAEVRGQSTMTPAEFWNSADTLEKLTYVRGFLDGAQVSQVTLLQLYRDAAKRRNWFRQTPVDGVPFDSAAARATRHLTSGGSPTAIVAGMDELYRNSANACISLASMTVAALRRLAGAHPDATEGRLMAMRSAALARCEL